MPPFLRLSILIFLIYFFSFWDQNNHRNNLAAEQIQSSKLPPTTDFLLSPITSHILYRGIFCKSKESGEQLWNRANVKRTRNFRIAGDMKRSLYSRFFWVKFNNYGGPWAKFQALLWHYQTSPPRGRPRHLEFYQISSYSPPKGKDIGSNNRAMPGPLPGPKHWLVALGPFSHLDPRVALQSSNREFVESIKKSFTGWRSNNSPETEID